MATTKRTPVDLDAPATVSPAPEPATTVTVTVVEGTLVYFDGEQRGGTITDVPAAIAAKWERQGWITTTA